MAPPSTPAASTGNNTTTGINSTHGDLRIARPLPSQGCPSNPSPSGIHPAADSSSSNLPLESRRRQLAVHFRDDIPPPPIYRGSQLPQGVPSHAGLRNLTPEGTHAAGQTRVGTGNTNTVHSGTEDLRDGIDPGDPVTATGRTKKRPRDRESSDVDDPDRYRYKAYHIRRAFDLYGHIPTIINNGVKRRAKELAGERDARFIQSDRDFETFQLIVAHLEGLNDDFVRLKRNPKAFRLLIRRIREAADQARNNDTANLKKDIACMLTADGSSVLTIMKGKRASSKHDRGFENDIMGQYLCPISLDWDDPFVRADIRDGKHAILASDWPRLLYADCFCDLDDLERGLGRNMALVRVVKYLFTGRSAAFSETAGGKTTRSGNAALAGMREITPRVVAYGACMLRYAISNEESWSTIDKEFNFEEFYWNVVDIFDDSEEFGRDLIAWWNMKIFGTSLETSLQVDPEHPPASNILLKEQRMAKRAAKVFGNSTNSSYFQDTRQIEATHSPTPLDSNTREPVDFTAIDDQAGVRSQALDFTASSQTCAEPSQASSYYPDHNDSQAVHPTPHVQDFHAGRLNNDDSSRQSRRFQESPESGAEELQSQEYRANGFGIHDTISQRPHSVRSSFHPSNLHTPMFPPPHSSSLATLAEACGVP